MTVDTARQVAAVSYDDVEFRPGVVVDYRLSEVGKHGQTVYTRRRGTIAACFMQTIHGRPFPFVDLDETDATTRPRRVWLHRDHVVVVDRPLLDTPAPAGALF